jgi:hypothetical protein
LSTLPDSLMLRFVRIHCGPYNTNSKIVLRTRIRQFPNA